MRRSDSDALREALSALLAGQQKFTPTSLGKAIGRDGSYIRDFLNERKASLGAIEISAIEREMQLPAGSLLNLVGSEGVAPMEAPARTAPQAEGLPLGAKDVPVYGTSVGGREGEFYLNGETIDYVRRLPGIASRKNVFGVYVESESMVPRYRPGDLVYASPSPPARPGDDVLIELAPMQGERNGPAFIKTLLRKTGSKIVCEQYNPKDEVEYDTRHVKAIYRIIPLAELAGF